MGIFRATDRHGPERVTTGQRSLGLFPITVHCYRIGRTLIDGGSPRMTDRLLEHWRDQAIDTVLLTHHHEDHVGLAGSLADAGAQVLAPEDTLPWLAEGLAMPGYRIMVWGRPDPVEADPLGRKVTTEDGSFEVVDTPGHSPEHVAFFEVERGWLFCGDAHLGNRVELRAKEDLAEYVASLERMRELDAETLFPGHGPAVSDPDAALADAIEHFEELRQEAHTLAGQGLSRRRIQHELLGWEGVMRYLTQGDFRKRHLVEQLLGWDKG